MVIGLALLGDAAGDVLDEAAVGADAHDVEPAFAGKGGAGAFLLESTMFTVCQCLSVFGLNMLPRSTHGTACGLPGNRSADRNGTGSAQEHGTCFIVYMYALRRRNNVHVLFDDADGIEKTGRVSTYSAFGKTGQVLGRGKGSEADEGGTDGGKLHFDGYAGNNRTSECILSNY